MSLDDEFQVLAVPGSMEPRHGWVGPFDPEAEAVWLPVVGPACFVVWRRLARELVERQGATTTSAAELAAAAGLAVAPGRQSGLMRSVRRLERFGVAWSPRARLLIVRCRLPALDDARLERLRPTIRQLQHELRDVAGALADERSSDPDS